jgi:putative ABC transport system permease protein
MDNHQPPRLARKILKSVSGNANIDDLLGDLDEWFDINTKASGARRAKLMYWKQALSLTFSYAVKKRRRDSKAGTFSSSSALSIDMLKNYIKISFRNLYQYKYFSLLNSFGLAIGMSISLLVISLYSYVSTYDNFHANKERIFTVTSDKIEGIEETAYASAPVALAEKVKDEFAGASQVVRIIKGNGVEVKTTLENIPVRTYYTESNFFRIFSFNLLQGTAAMLDQPNQVVLTTSAALKLFNQENIVGKNLELADGTLLEVAGVMKDPPHNTHLSFEMLVSFNTLPETKVSPLSRWTDYHNQYVYVMLNEQSSPDQLEEYLSKVGSAVNAKSPIKVNFDVQQVEEIAMGPDLRNSIGITWESSGFILFAVFAVLILLPACFNYTNISIARALRRAKEIGLRKTLGGRRSQIFFQFITETVVITFISLIGALLLFVLIRSEFQSMLVAGSMLDLSLTWKMIFMFIGFALLTGFVAGIFPAIFFAGLNPIQALKSKVNGRGTSLRVRKVLTIFQFALSFGFILSLVVFSRQYHYSLNFDFGFDKQNKVDVDLQDVPAEQFRNAFATLSPVRSISMSSGLLGVQTSRTWMHYGQNDSAEVAQMYVDPHYIDAFKLTLLAGKNFPDETWHGEQYLIVNEEFIKALKINDPADAIGKVYSVDGRELEVIGVLRNFHFAPLNQPIDKFFFRMDPKRFAYANLEVSSTDAFAMFNQMEDVWKTLPTEKRFSAKYFEDELNEAYDSYRVLLKIIGFMGLLAITISMLGMLGMVVYTAETKTKEVGIRKIMGATAASIVLLLSKDYLKMMAWAIFFAVPVTGFILDKMLEQLQYYSVRLSVWDVGMSIFILAILGLLTITSQTYRAAMANPATTLKTE